MRASGRISPAPAMRSIKLPSLSSSGFYMSPCTRRGSSFTPAKARRFMSNRRGIACVLKASQIMSRYVPSASENSYVLSEESA